MTVAEVEKIEAVISGMTHEEQEVAVRSIPATLLHNEIVRRLEEDEEKLNSIRRCLL